MERREAGTPQSPPLPALKSRLVSSRRSAPLNANAGDEEVARFLSTEFPRFVQDFHVHVSPSSFLLFSRVEIMASLRAHLNARETFVTLAARSGSACKKCRKMYAYLETRNAYLECEIHIVTLTLSRAFILSYF